MKCASPFAELCHAGRRARALARGPQREARVLESNRTFEHDVDARASRPIPPSAPRSCCFVSAWRWRWGSVRTADPHDARPAARLQRRASLLDADETRAARMRRRPGPRRRQPGRGAARARDGSRERPRVRPSARPGHHRDRHRRAGRHDRGHDRLQLADVAPLRRLHRSAVAAPGRSRGPSETVPLPSRASIRRSPRSPTSPARPTRRGAAAQRELRRTTPTGRRARRGARPAARPPRPLASATPAPSAEPRKQAAATPTHERGRAPPGGAAARRRRPPAARSAADPLAAQRLPPPTALRLRRRQRPRSPAALATTSPASAPVAPARARPIRCWRRSRATAAAAAGASMPAASPAQERMQARGRDGPHAQRIAGDSSRRWRRCRRAFAQAEQATLSQRPRLHPGGDDAALRAARGAVLVRCGRASAGGRAGSMPRPTSRPAPPPAAAVDLGRAGSQPAPLSRPAALTPPIVKPATQPAPLASSLLGLGHRLGQPPAGDAALVDRRPRGDDGARPRSRAARRSSAFGSGEREPCASAASSTMEELIDLEQQAEFFVVLGQDEAAIALLEAYIAASARQPAAVSAAARDPPAPRRPRRVRRPAPELSTSASTPSRPSGSADLHRGRASRTTRRRCALLQALWPTPLRRCRRSTSLLFRRDDGRRDVRLPRLPRAAVPVLDRARDRRATSRPTSARSTCSCRSRTRRSSPALRTHGERRGRPRRLAVAGRRRSMDATCSAGGAAPAESSRRRRAGAATAQSARSRSSARASVSSFLAKQKRAIRCSKPSA